jgi:hypothetical protein
MLSSKFSDKLLSREIWSSPNHFLVDSLLVPYRNVKKRDLERAGSTLLGVFFFVYITFLTQFLRSFESQPELPKYIYSSILGSHEIMSQVAPCGAPAGPS